MINKIPQDVKNIYDKLEEKGYEIYLVGGCVRNLLMDLKVKDWDLTTSAIPEEILKVFPNGFYNNDFGTVGIPTDEEGIVEITTYRTEYGFSNKRHPDKVAWGKTIEEDLSRRDFTMNAIALKWSMVNLPAGKAGGKSSIVYVDPFSGRKDIENKISQIKNLDEWMGSSH